MDIRSSQWNYLWGDKGKTAVILCPGCGVEFSVMGHPIEREGMVEGTITCPRECGFSDELRLIGWDPLYRRDSLSHREGIPSDFLKSEKSRLCIWLVARGYVSMRWCFLSPFGDSTFWASLRRLLQLDPCFSGITL